MAYARSGGRFRIVRADVYRWYEPELASQFDTELAPVVSILADPTDRRSFTSHNWGMVRTRIGRYYGSLFLQPPRVT